MNLGMAKKADDRGFSLIEIAIVATVVMSILLIVALPSMIGNVNKGQQVVCDSNRVQLERMYETYLTLENIEHSEAVLVQYMQNYGEDICPHGGDISYGDGAIQCTVYSINDRSESDSMDGNDDEPIPFL